VTRLADNHPAIREALATIPLERAVCHSKPRKQRQHATEQTPQDSVPFLHPLTVIVPRLPPSVNHMYLANKHGGKRLTDEAKAFREAVAEEVQDMCRLTRWRYVAGVPLSLTLFLTFGTKARQDGDNRLKAAADALALALGFDDKDIAAFHVYTLGVDPRRPLCEMRLTDARQDAAYQRAAAAATRGRRVENWSATWRYWGLDKCCRVR
jgi:Holliday junction resolvase RusA-like endonuclease